MATGISSYRDSPGGPVVRVYDNCFVMQFDSEGRCSRVHRVVRAAEIRVSAKRGIFLPPFDELDEPRTLVELAEAAEERGWDGFFLWDHIAYRAPFEPSPTPGSLLGAIANATGKLRLGPMVTPLPRRRVQKVARETVTLDRLSGGRLTFGVGLAARRTSS